MPRRVPNRVSGTDPALDVPKPKPRISLVPANETKHDKFIRLANQRVKRIITNLRQFGKLGAPAYDRTSEEIDKLEAALKAEVDLAITKLRQGHETQIRDIL